MKSLVGRASGAGGHKFMVRETHPDMEDFAEKAAPTGAALCYGVGLWQAQSWVLTTRTEQGE